MKKLSLVLITLLFACTSCEVEVADFDDVNLALTASVTASSTFSGYSVDKINDGDRNTGLGGDFSWSNNHIDGGILPQWVTIDLGSTETINRMAIYTTEGYELQDFSVETSTNNSTWTTQRTISGNTSTFIQFDDFFTVNARYVRIMCTKGPDSQSIYARLNEVEIYGF